MPRRYAKKRSRKTNKNRKASLYRNPTVVPDSKIVRHRYVDYVTLDTSSGTSDRNIYRANSMFDPNQTGIGSQPLGFDQWSVFYDHYTVLGSKCTAQFLSSSGSGVTGTSIVGVILTDNSLSLPTPTAIMEQNNSNWKVMTALTAQQKATVSSYYSPKKFFGLTDIGDNRALIGASTNANPVEDAYFSVYTAAINGVADSALVSVIVTIEFTVMYTERKTLTPS